MCKYFWVLNQIIDAKSSKIIIINVDLRYRGYETKEIFSVSKLS